MSETHRREPGSEPDALARTHGGGPAQTTLALLVSSDHPAEVGLQGELVGTRRGRREPRGLDGDGLPLATAISFRGVQALGALAERARLDNALFAAAAGRLDLLEREVGPDCSLTDEQGRAALDLAREKGHAQVERLLERPSS